MAKKITTKTGTHATHEPRTVTRVQTGIRIEKTLLKVLKGLAEYCDMTLGDLLEGIVLSSFEGRSPFEPQTMKTIERLKEIYGCELTEKDSHRMREHTS